MTHTDQRLRILPQDLWDRVKARQGAVEGASIKLRTVLKRGRLPTHILSGLLTCEHCGGTFRRTDSRVYGCASHKDGGPAACTNSVRVPWQLAEKKLLDTLAQEMLSPEGVALLERRVREHMKAQARVPKAPPKTQAAQVAKKAAEIEQLRALMKAGTLSQAVAHAAIEKAEQELHALERATPKKEEQETVRVIRMLPRAAELLRERIGAGNLGLRDPRSIVQGRNVLFNAFGGKVPLRCAPVQPGEKPYLIARVGLNRTVLLEAAGGCFQNGSGGRIR